MKKIERIACILNDDGAWTRRGQKTILDICRIIIEPDSVPPTDPTEMTVPGNELERLRAFAEAAKPMMAPYESMLHPTRGQTRFLAAFAALDPSTPKYEGEARKFKKDDWVKDSVGTLFQLKERTTLGNYWISKCGYPIYENDCRLTPDELRAEKMKKGAVVRWSTSETSIEGPVAHTCRGTNIHAELQMEYTGVWREVDDCELIRVAPKKADD